MLLAIYRTNVSGFAYAHDVVLHSNNYALATVNSYAFAACMRIHASKTKVMPALIPGVQRQIVLIVSGSLDEVDKFIAKDQGTKEITNRINSTHPLFPHCLKWTGLPGSGAFDSAVQLQKVVSTGH